VNQAEVVRRVFTKYANGTGLATITRCLNDEGDDTYRGVVVWNRLKRPTVEASPRRYGV
jgi:hypothetical protein